MQMEMKLLMTMMVITMQMKKQMQMNDIEYEVDHLNEIQPWLDLFMVQLCQNEVIMYFKRSTQTLVNHDKTDFAKKTA